jgi:hypothetical protein
MHDRISTSSLLSTRVLLTCKPKAMHSNACIVALGGLVVVKLSDGLKVESNAVERVHRSNLATSLQWWIYKPKTSPRSGCIVRTWRHHDYQPQWWSKSQKTGAFWRPAILTVANLSDGLQADSCSVKTLQKQKRRARWRPKGHSEIRSYVYSRSKKEFRHRCALRLQPQTCTQLACRILRYYIICRPKKSFSPVLIEKKSVVLLCEAALARAGVEGPRSSSFTLDA